MIVFGIDPGVSGGIAVCNEYSRVSFKLKDATEADIAAFLSQPANFAFIERVSSSPQMGVVSAFTFGRGYGLLRGLLIALKIPFEEVRPQVWQKAMGCLTKGDKNVSKARAQQLFPDLKITHSNADALLLAEYGRRELALRSHKEIA